MLHFLDQSRPIAVAHRGGAAEAPENSLAAFAHAVALGFTSLETDVHVTADGVLVALHDPTLDRVTDRRGRVRDLPHREVARARISGVEPIPTLDELIEAFPQATWTIDAKHTSAVEPLITAVRRHRLQERVCLGAFSDRRLAVLRAALPGVCTALGPREVVRLVAAARLIGSRRIGQRRIGQRRLRGLLPPGAAVLPLGVGPLRVVTPRVVELARELGLATLVWTVNHEADMRRLLDLGVDGIMTDRTALLRDVLRDRGEWPG